MSKILHLLKAFNFTSLQAQVFKIQLAKLKLYRKCPLVRYVGCQSQHSQGMMVRQISPRTQLKRLVLDECDSHALNKNYCGD